MTEMRVGHQTAAHWLDHLSDTVMTSCLKTQHTVCSDLLHNNNNDNDRLTAFDPGQPGYAGTRRNIHPLTPIRIIVLPLSSFSICNGPWHPLYSQSPYYITSAAVAVDSSHVTASSQYGTEIWRDRVPDFRGCDAEAARAK